MVTSEALSEEKMVFCPFYNGFLTNNSEIRYMLMLLDAEGWKLCLLLMLYIVVTFSVIKHDSSCAQISP